MTAVKTSFKTDAQVSHLADNGLPVTSADVRRLVAEKKALREALTGMVHVFETMLNNVDCGEEYEKYLLARAALRSEQGESDE